MIVNFFWQILFPSQLPHQPEVSLTASQLYAAEIQRLPYTAVSATSTETKRGPE